jgi:hypothetical protein
VSSTPGVATDRVARRVAKSTADFEVQRFSFEIEIPMTSAMNRVFKLQGDGYFSR